MLYYVHNNVMTIAHMQLYLGKMWALVVFFAVLLISGTSMVCMYNYTHYKQLHNRQIY